MKFFLHVLHHLVDLMRFAVNITTLVRAFAMTATSVILMKDVVLNVFLTPTAQATELVSVTNVKIHVQERVVLTLNAQQYIIHQLAHVFRVTLEMLSVAAILFCVSFIFYF